MVKYQPLNKRPVIISFNLTPTLSFLINRCLFARKNAVLVIL